MATATSQPTPPAREAPFITLSLTLSQREAIQLYTLMGMFSGPTDGVGVERSLRTVTDPLYDHLELVLGDAGVDTADLPAVLEDEESVTLHVIPA